MSDKKKPDEVQETPAGAATDGRSAPDTLDRRAKTRAARRKWAEELYPRVTKTEAGYLASVAMPSGDGEPITWNVTETDPELSALLDKIDKAQEAKRQQMRDLFSDPEAAAIARQLLKDQPALPGTDTV